MDGWHVLRFPLSDGTEAVIEYPGNLSEEDAERMAGAIRALAIPRTGAEAYFAGRMRDVDYANAYREARTTTGNL